MVTQVNRGWYKNKKNPLDLVYVASDGVVFRPTIQGKKEVTFETSRISRGEYTREFDIRSLIEGLQIDSYHEDESDCGLCSTRETLRLDATQIAINKTLEDLSISYPKIDPASFEELPANYCGITRKVPFFVR